MTKEAFFHNCDGKYCPRKKVKNKFCAKFSYRESCWKKFSAYQVKFLKKKQMKLSHQNDADIKWLETKRQVWLYYFGIEPVDVAIKWEKYCLYYGSLSKQDQLKVSRRYPHSLYLNSHIDPAHIMNRSHVLHKYDVNNIVLIGRLWHSFLDQYIDPVTGKHLTKEERGDIFKQIKEYGDKCHIALSDIKN